MSIGEDGATASFGHMLRRHRLTAELTQEALAERAGLSKRGISDLERGERTRPQRETVRRLADALGLAGPKRAIFVAAARRPGARPTPAANEIGLFPRARAPLPLDPLVGREQEVAAVAAMLRREEIRLLTLTGPGGVGKTRLALAAMAEVRGEFADGLAFVDLAPIRDPALVLPNVADRLGVREPSGHRLAERLRDRLASRQVLLLLDNLEQVLAAAPLLVDLLADCPRVTVMATSRVLLRVSGEHAYAVPPLALPERDPVPPFAILEQSEAVRLFAARAQAADAGFALTAAAAPAVAEICHRVDGLPLAIELAAARVRVLPPAMLLTRLQPRLPQLTSGRRDAPARQRTMHATIAWSHDLLAPPEQQLFRQLSVFVGGWTLEAVEAVAGGGAPDVLDGLAALAEAHLITRTIQTDGEVRFGMLETVREFGLEQLAASGDEAPVRDRHAAFFVQEVEAAGPWLEDNRGGPWRTGAGIDRWLDRLTVEWPNVRAAADWAVHRGEGDVLLRLGCAIYPFFNTYSLGDAREGRRWLEAGLAAGRGADAALRVWALGFASTLATVDGDHARGAALAAEGLTLAREQDYRRGEAEALDSLGFSAMFRGDLEQADAHYSALLAILRDAAPPAGEGHSLNAFSGGRPADDPEWVAHTFDSLAHIALGKGDRERAAELAGNARAMLPASGCSAHHARLLGTLGAIALAAGDHPRAARLWRESLEQWRALRNRRGVADGLAGLASVLQNQGEHGMAARFFGAAESLLEEVGARHLIHAVALDRILAATRAALTSAEAAAWRDGRARPDVAIAAALALSQETTARRRRDAALTGGPCHAGPPAADSES